MERFPSESLDVSCRATAHTVNYFLLHNHPASELLKGLPYSLSHLENVSASISWEHYVQFLGNSLRVLEDASFEDLCINYTDSPYLKSMLTTGGLWFSPARFFVWAAGPGGNLIEKIYRCLKTSVVQVSNRVGVLDVQVRDGFSLAPDYFWESICLGIAGATKPVGMPAFSEVKWQPVDRGARFTITFPRRSVTRYFLSLMTSLINRDWFQQRYINQLYLEGRAHWLQQEIAKRAEIEKALRESESHHRILMESAPEAILVYNLDEDRIISANRNAVVLFGQNQENFRTKSLHDYIDFPDGLRDREALRDYMQNSILGATLVSEFSFSQPSGTIIPCEARLVCLKSDRQTLIRASINDISARKKIENELIRARDAAIETAKQLKRSELELTKYTNRLKEVVELACIGIFDHDHLTGTIYRSAELQKIYDWQSSESSDPYDFMKFIAEEDRSRVMADIQRSHSPSGTGEFHHSYRFLRPDGSVIWCEAQGTTLFSDSPTGRIPERTIGAVIEITDRVEREISLSNSRGQLQAILESTRDAVFSIDTEYRFLTFNQQHWDMMYAAYGVRIELGKSILDYLPVVRDRELAYSCLQRALQGERIQTTQQYGDSGLLRTTYELTCNPMRDSKGDVTGVAVFARDIGMQIQSQESMRELEEVQYLAIEASLLGMWKFSTRSQLYTLDARSQKLLTFNQSVIGEADFQSRIHPEDLDRFLENINPLHDGESDAPVKVNCRLMLPQGDCRWVTASAIRFVRRSSADELDEVWLIGTLADITEYERTSTLLTKSLEEKETMLKEIHHRVKNNLQVISSLLNLQANDFYHTDVQQFSLESQRRIRAMALVHELLYQSESLAQINMGEYVDKLTSNLILVYGSERATIECQVANLSLDLQQALPLGLILSELAANSLKHAFPANDRKGKICIELRRTFDATILLSINDTGIGISESLSTVPNNSLGLKLVHLLTQQLRGRLTIGSTNGTHVTVEIPGDN